MRLNVIMATLEAIGRWLLSRNLGQYGKPGCEVKDALKSGLEFGKRPSQANGDKMLAEFTEAYAELRPHLPAE